jgi:hypothetical protein
MTLDMLTQLGGSGAREAWDDGRVFLHSDYAFDAYHIAITLTPWKTRARYQVRTDLYPFCYARNHFAPYLPHFGEGRIYVSLYIFFFFSMQQRSWRICASSVFIYHL